MTKAHHVDHTVDARSLATLSRQLLTAVRTDGDISPLRHRLASVDERTLSSLTVRKNRPAAKTFWINVYNAAAQHALAIDANRFEDRRQFFGEPQITVAGTALSLDSIEHGILRGSQSKYGLGYLPQLFSSAFERRHRLPADELDYRLHFALNCGAASCPPILAYNIDRIEAQLETATAAYLSSEVSYDSTTHTATVPRLLLWYRGDFDGKNGIYQLLSRQKLIPPETTPQLRYASYDWSLTRGAYRTD